MSTKITVTFEVELTDEECWVDDEMPEAFTSHDILERIKEPQGMIYGLEEWMILDEFQCRVEARTVDPVGAISESFWSGARGYY